MADTWLPIDNGRQQSSYKQFDITIPANGSYVLNNPFNYFRCLDSNMNFQIAWSTNNGKTDFQAGLGIKFDQVIPYAQIFNPSGAPLVLTVGCGIGYFDDSRLSVSGTVKTEPAPYSFFSTQKMIFSGAPIEIPPAQKIIIQNTGNTNIYVGGSGTDGLQVLPMGSFEMSYSGTVNVYGTSGQSIVVGSFS